jgi:hypothetical protein
LNDEWNQIPNVVWNEKQVVLYCIYHNYTHGFLNLNDKFYFIFQIILDGISLWIHNPKVQTQKVKLKIKCTTFWNVYIIIQNTKRHKLQVTIACFYGGFIFFSLSTSSFISIFPSLIYLFIPIFIFCPMSFLLNMFCHNGVIVLYLEPWRQWKRNCIFCGTINLLSACVWF